MTILHSIQCPTTLKPQATTVQAVRAARHNSNMQCRPPQQPHSMSSVSHSNPSSIPIKEFGRPRGQLVRCRKRDNT